MSLGEFYDLVAIIVVSRASAPGEAMGARGRVEGYCTSFRSLVLVSVLCASFPGYQLLTPTNSLSNPVTVQQTFENTASGSASVSAAVHYLYSAEWLESTGCITLRITEFLRRVHRQEIGRAMKHSVSKNCVSVLRLREGDTNCVGVPQQEIIPVIKQKKTNSVALSPRANYTD
jgi:hypothetical protein